MATVAEIVSPRNAPFSAPIIPTGMNRVLTGGEVTALNTTFPIPPNGNTWWVPKTGLPGPVVP